MTGQYPSVNGVMRNGGKVDPNRATLPRHFANHGYWTARVSKIYHMGVPIGIEQGSHGADDEASWTERFNSKGPEWRAPVSYTHLTLPTILRV